MTVTLVSGGAQPRMRSERVEVYGINDPHSQSRNSQTLTNLHNGLES